MTGERTCWSCGVPIGRARSSPDHKRFFALIRAAFHHWPLQYEFQPDDTEHLRAWLIVKAGHRITTTIKLPSKATPAANRMFFEAVKAGIKAAGGRAFVVPMDDQLAVLAPKSIAKMGQQEFAVVRDDVTALIESITETSANRLLHEESGT